MYIRKTDRDELTCKFLTFCAVTIPRESREGRRCVGKSTTVAPSHESCRVVRCWQRHHFGGSQCSTMSSGRSGIVTSQARGNDDNKYHWRYEAQEDRLGSGDTGARVESKEEQLGVRTQVSIASARGCRRNLRLCGSCQCVPWLSILLL